MKAITHSEYPIANHRVECPCDGAVNEQQYRSKTEDRPENPYRHPRGISLTEESIGKAKKARILSPRRRVPPLLNGAVAFPNLNFGAVHVLLARLHI
jgi:hypothetical protein